MTNKTQSVIYGIHPVREALQASGRQCYKIVIEKGTANQKIQTTLKLSKKNNVKVESLSREVFRKKYSAYLHQGIVGYFSEKEMIDLEELISLAFQQSPQPTLVLLDGIQDPQNMGAIIRSAEGLGVNGIIIPKHRSAPLSEAVAKSSAGAIESLPVASVTNLAHAVEPLKKEKFWLVGVEPQEKKACYQFTFDMPVALVFGSEEKGIRPALKKACDFFISIPMQGQIGSLNASAAAAVVFYEILRQKKERGID